MEQKILIDSLDTALITCPKCGNKKILQLSEYKQVKSLTRIKCRCSCGHTQRAVIEKRSGPDQDIRLAGTFLAKGKTRCSGKMTIKKLNSNGITLKTNTDRKLPPGLSLMLEFVLDDPKQSIVQKEVMVLARSGRYLTAEFVSKNHQDNLGPYLFFNKLYM
ncbi:hypothetical protein [Desulfospira joergensenii]|uniref:hypothetical protein n=1 Tax=Desulfospira joergensenii TaxID=53329 RepID=UPI0003B5592F|nr:hypothetical protein [Desulfospira joergensenii]